MDCTLTGVIGSIEDKLVAYHFGTASDEDREAIDEHLVACGACLRRYLQLKHQLDLEGRAPKPTPRLRARLRADIEAEFRPRGVRRVQSWLNQPISRGRGIVGGVALAMAASAVLAILPARRQTPTPAPASMQVVQVDNTQVDTARTFAESRSVY